MSSSPWVREQALKLAERVLEASGSGLRHYTPQNKERILAATSEAIEELVKATPHVTELTVNPKLRTLSDVHILDLAMIAGFLVSSVYGKEPGQRMPGANSETVKIFAKSIIAAASKK